MTLLLMYDKLRSFIRVRCRVGSDVGSTSFCQTHLMHTSDSSRLTFLY